MLSVKIGIQQFFSYCTAKNSGVGNYTTNRIPLYIAKEKELKEVLNEVPTAKEIEKLLGKIGLDMQNFYDTYDSDTINKAVLFAKDLRDRFTALWMYYDIFGTEKVVL